MTEQEKFEAWFKANPQVTHYRAYVNMHAIAKHFGGKIAYRDPQILNGKVVDWGGEHFVWPTGFEDHEAVLEYMYKGLNQQFNPSYPKTNGISQLDADIQSTRFDEEEHW